MDLKISLLPDATSINDTDFCSLVQNGTTKKSLFSVIKSYILGGRTIGGTGQNDVTINSGAQTMLGKTLVTPALTSPIINGVGNLSATSVELDKMHNLPTTAIELGYVSGARSNLQVQIDSKVSIASIADVTKIYSQSFAYSGSTKSITEANILNGLSGYYVDRAVQVSLYKYSTADEMDLQTNAIKPSQQTDHSQVHLKGIDITGLTSGNYLVVVIYKLVPISGV